MLMKNKSREHISVTVKVTNPVEVSSKGDERKTLHPSSPYTKFELSIFYSYS